MRTMFAPRMWSCRRMGDDALGAAWVHILGGETAAKEVIEQLLHQWMGGRYIELRHSRKAGACRDWSRDSSHFRQ